MFQPAGETSRICPYRRRSHAATCGPRLGIPAASSSSLRACMHVRAAATVRRTRKLPQEFSCKTTPSASRKQWWCTVEYILTTCTSLSYLSTCDVQCQWAIWLFVHDTQQMQLAPHYPIPCLAYWVFAHSTRPRLCG